MAGRTPLKALIDGLPAAPKTSKPEPKGETLTTRPKQASMQPETRPPEPLQNAALSGEYRFCTILAFLMSGPSTTRTICSRASSGFKK
jgi:hypothetical protein